MRSRNIKPGYFDNELLGVDETDPLIHLLFAGLWCYADKAGRCQDRPLKIKSRIFPHRNISPDVFNGYLTELERMNFILRYEIDGEHYIQVLNFHVHQSPHKTEKDSVIPPPPLELVKNRAFSDLTDNPPLMSRDSRDLNALDSLIPGFTDSLIQSVSPNSTKSEEDQLREAICRKQGVKPQVPKITDEEWGMITEIYEFWKTTFEKTGGAKLNVSRGRAVLDRLRPPVAYSVADIKRAIQGCGMNPFNRGMNDRKKVFDDLELICRDDAHLERYMSDFEERINGNGQERKNGNSYASTNSTRSGESDIDAIIADSQRFQPPELNVG